MYNISNQTKIHEKIISAKCLKGLKKKIHFESMKRINHQKVAYSRLWSDCYFYFANFSYWDTGFPKLFARSLIVQKWSFNSRIFSGSLIGKGEFENKNKSKRKRKLLCDEKQQKQTTKPKFRTTVIATYI